MEDKNPADNEEWTPLHITAQERRLEIVNYISQHLEDKNPAKNDGKTTLCIASNT